MAEQLELPLVQGKTFTLPIRWETERYFYAPIANITRTGPAVVTAVGHGLPDGWRTAVVSVNGMVDINAHYNPPRDKDFHIATVLNADTVELNEVNAAGFKAYTSGGYLQYFVPHTLTGYDARMTIRDKVGGTVLQALTTGTGELVIDPTGYTITVLLSAATTAAYTWTRGVYDLELVSPDVVPVVTLLLYGTVTVTKEVTT